MSQIGRCLSGLLNRTPSRSRKYFAYSLYGVSLLSEWRLPYHECSEKTSGPIIKLRRAESSLLNSDLSSEQKTQGQPFRHSAFHDGTHYFCWQDCYEFLISPGGKQI